MQNNSAVALLWWCLAQTHKEEKALHRGGSVTHRRAQSDCLQNRLPITQHFGKVRTNVNTPVHAVFNMLLLLCLSSLFFLTLVLTMLSYSVHYCCMSVTSSSACSQTQGCRRHAGWARHQWSLESVSENSLTLWELFRVYFTLCFNVSSDLQWGLTPSFGGMMKRGKIPCCMTRRRWICSGRFSTLSVHETFTSAALCTVHVA